MPGAEVAGQSPRRADRWVRCPRWRGQARRRPGCVGRIVPRGSSSSSMGRLPLEVMHRGSGHGLGNVPCGTTPDCPASNSQKLSGKGHSERDSPQKAAEKAAFRRASYQSFNGPARAMAHTGNWPECVFMIRQLVLASGVVGFLAGGPGRSGPPNKAHDVAGLDAARQLVFKVKGLT